MPSRIFSRPVQAIGPVVSFSTRKLTSREDPVQGRAPAPLATRGFDLSRIPVVGAATVEAGASQPSFWERLVATAQRGVEGVRQELPFRRQIETSFGQPVLAYAYCGPQAAAACRELDADAFTTGGKVAFRSGHPNLHTAAHEAAHVLQQQRGVRLEGSLGQRGDVYERQADLAAHLVLQRQSARHLFTGAGTSTGTAIQRQEHREGRRDEDRQERTRREQERDRDRRRPEGGRDRSRSMLGDLDSDWAGRAMLERYLFGEGDWDVADEPQWSAYMMRSERLRGQLYSRLLNVARRYRSGPWQEDVPISFADTFAAELENGEGIIGYQYLHGTNSDVGGFQMSGTVTITHPVSGATSSAGGFLMPGTFAPDQPFGRSTAVAGSTSPGRKVLRLYVAYRWNDMIDPNPQYQTDTIKSRIANVISLGQAESYRMSITWHAGCEVEVGTGDAMTVRGYPGTDGR